MAVVSEVTRAVGQESLLSVPVSLPYVDEPILLSVGLLSLYMAVIASS